MDSNSQKGHPRTLCRGCPFDLVCSGGTNAKLAKRRFLLADEKKWFESD